MANVAEVEVRAAADVGLVLIGPADKAVFWLQGWVRGLWRQECRHSLWGGRGDGLVTGAGAAPWRELVEEEAVAGDEGGFVFGGFVGRIGEAGGVLGAEAHFVERVGGEVAALGEAFLFVLGGFVLGVAAVEQVDGGVEGGGVFIDPSVVVEGVGVGLAGGEDFFGAVDFAGEIGGFLDADLELAVEAGVIVGKGEAGAAAGSGEQALELGEGLDLFLGHLADFAEGSALGDATVFDELDLGVEEWDELDGRLTGDGVFLGEAADDGGTGDGVDQCAVEALRIAEEDADGEVECAFGGHDSARFGMGIGGWGGQLKTSSSITATSCRIGLGLARQKAVCVKKAAGAGRLRGLIRHNMLIMCMMRI